ncbi:uncharacterized protein ZBIST_4101 [Zygosaccharomyces bailii]|nr:uncharacterized protein ZBIST_4101 [Zygosaccharomyces bailii]
MEQPTSTVNGDIQGNVSNPISSGTLRSDSSQSSTIHREGGNEGDNEGDNETNLSDLLKKSKILQSEINDIFMELKHLNSEVRSDIDDFCHIGADSSATFSNVSKIG